ncbi:MULTISPECIES: ankyrin repeat domain-containing protein [Burkholderia cepacia complex]|nr:MULTISPECIES: ankyrin repeat domain-containing protein [Burkholderia cepacia complex]MCA7983695.1 ankyrin repeat domain-containing protein [Burkholderia vietnamiensis]
MSDRTVSKIEEEMEQYQEEGNVGKVMDLVDELGNLGDRLCTACAHADWEEIQHLESLGMDLTENTFLKVAAKYGQPEVIMYLADKGADVHVDNDAAIRHAVQHSKLESVQCLVSLGANVDAAIEATNECSPECPEELKGWLLAWKNAKELRDSLEVDLTEKETIAPKTKV